MSELYLFLSITLLGVAVLLNTCLQQRSGHQASYTPVHHEESPVATQLRQGGQLELVLEN